MDAEAPQARKIPCKLLNIGEKERRCINRSFDAYGCSVLQTEKEIYWREKARSGTMTSLRDR